MSRFSEDDQNPECQSDTGCEPVELVILPRTGDIGNFEVHRALPSHQRQLVGPFIFWDQMGPGEFITGQGVDVRPHPHINLATVTYLFDGTMDHKDSLGSDMRIAPGDVNLMVAGKGIVHSERTGQDVRAEPSNLFGIQSWLALPRDKEETDAAFEHTDKGDLPFIEEKGWQMRLIMGGYHGEKSPVRMLSDTLYADVQMKAVAVMDIPPDAEERALYVVSGEIEIGGVSYASMQMLILRPGDQVVVKALSDVRMMALGGEAMDGPRYMDWNFVSSSKERIQQAREDWREGRFPKVPGDDKEFIPLPEQS